MKILTRLSIAFLLLLVASSLPAVAGTVNLQFNTAGNNSYGGYSTYPYNFKVSTTVNGQTESQFEALMCVGFNEHITGGETWQATEMTVSDYITYLVGKSTDPTVIAADTTKADELAYLYTLALANGGANSAINAEAWFTNEGQPTPEPDAALLADFTPGSYSNVRVYVPTTNQTGWTDGVPQTFLGSTPEPGTLLTLGTGLLGLAGLARKRLFS